MGLVNQLGMFLSDLSEHAAPLRDLLQQRNVFQWSSVHDKAFQKMKAALLSAKVLHHFSRLLDHEVALQVDASRLHGLGFALMQKIDDKWRLVHCGSRFLTPAESRYAMTELELLAGVWAMTKMRVYLLGRPRFTPVSYTHLTLPTIYSV